MFGSWRLTLRQVEEAVRLDRLDEALELAGRPDVADHRKAVRLRARIAARLAERAREQMQQGHSQAAWRDLRRAEQAGAPAMKLVSVRGEFMKQGLAEVRDYLDMGNPRQARSLAEQLKQRGDSTDLRRLSEAAACWERGEEAASVGEFPRATHCLETALKHLGQHAGLEQRLRSLRTDTERAVGLREKLHSALAVQDWPGVLQVADSLLDLASECREAVHARDEAWRRLGGVPCTRAVTMQHAGSQNTPESLADCGVRDAGSGLRDRFILWIDGVGGYLVCLADVITIGQAGPENAVDIPIFGDLSRQHAILLRDDEGYLIRSDRGSSVNGRPVKQSPLRHGDVVRLGRSVELRFSTPCPVSETARMNLTSGHRLQLSLAGILLMAQTCVLGPSVRANVQVPSSGQAILYRQGSELWCRTDGNLEIDGQTHEGRGPLRSCSRLTFDDWSFTLEPLNSRLSQV